jgi:hypothetical protein
MNELVNCNFVFKMGRHGTRTFSYVPAVSPSRASSKKVEVAISQKRAQLVTYANHG